MIRKYILAWAIMAVLVIVGLGSMNWFQFSRFVQRGRPVTGSVVALHLNDHNRASYRYVVDGRAYNGIDQSWQPNPDASRLDVGQSVVVYYDPKDPSDSVLGNPRPMLNNETIFIAMAAIFVPTFLVIAWHFNLRKKKWFQ